MTVKKIDDSIKAQVIDSHNKGFSRKDISEKFGISLTSVGRIINSQIPGPDRESGKKSPGNSERMRKIEDLEKRVLQLEKKIELLIAKKK